MGLFLQGDAHVHVCWFLPPPAHLHGARGEADANYCLTDMRTVTSKNITRICAELGLEVATVSPMAVKLAYKAYFRMMTGSRRSCR